MLRFNDIADRVLENHPNADLELLQRAYVFSAKVHDGQERMSGEPYIAHPLEVGGILADMRMDELTVAAALLHDTLEDTLTTPEELERLFGSEVTFLVEGLTKIARIEFKSQRERQAESFRKMLVAMSKDIRILLIKLGDRLHNMRTLEFMKEEGRQRVAQETLDIYAPLAHRLGIQWMKQELQERAFRALNPERAKELERALHVNRREREKYIEEVIGTLSSKLASAGVQAEVTGRVKDLSSIHEKLERQNLSLDQLYDVIAFRIVLDGPAESVYAALGVVHATWRPVPGRFKDYVALPKANGYQSLHTTVIGPYGERMEIQIRTADMHRMAELGIAAHWKYKEGKDAADDADDRKFAWLRQLLERQQELDDPHEFFDTVKVDLFADEVFVFTPTGEVVNLPRGATTIDFAYAIHTEVGGHCAGARVNGKLVALRHELEDGDTVEIVTSDSQFPRKDWLEFAVSGRARSKIRHAIRAEEKRRSQELGREILERELRKAKISLPRLLEADGLDEVVRARGRGGVEDLFSAVGYGKVSATDVVQTLKRQDEPPAESEPPKRRLFRRKSSDPSGIRVSGHEDVMVRFAQCCTPLPGDDVIGFVTRGRGVTVHAKDCRKVFELDPERRIDVDWSESGSAPRRIRIKVLSIDQPGLLAKVTKSISAAGINIDGARVTTTPEQTAVHSFDVWVTDVRTLNSVLKDIQRIKGVTSVERVRT